jgi:transposase
MARPNLRRRVRRYSDEFKATAVRLSSLSGVRVGDVARSLDIHPFLLSRWRKDEREGRLVAKKVELDETTKAELKELRKLRRDHARLLEEHDLLKKAIRFVSERRERSSSSSTRDGKRTG